MGHRHYTRTKVTYNHKETSYPYCAVNYQPKKYLVFNCLYIINVRFIIMYGRLDSNRENVINHDDERAKESGPNEVK